MKNLNKKKSRGRKGRETENLKFSDGTRIKMTTSQAGAIRQGGVGIAIIPEEKQTTELPQEVAAEKDEFDGLEYPPPSRNKEFRKIWAQGIKNITDRENFDTSHLSLFETYCHLIVNMRRLDEFITQNGQTYRVVTVMGETRRTHPEVLERNKTVSQIAIYARLLDLLPKKDKSVKVPKDGEKEWE